MFISSGSAPSKDGPGRGMQEQSEREKSKEILRTKPAAIEKKQGTASPATPPTGLLTNYFSMKLKSEWRLYQYRVDISPEEDRTFMIKVMVRQHTEVLKDYIFDGTMLFSPTLYAGTSNGQVLSLVSKNQEGQVYQITIRLVGECGSMDFYFIQFFNIVMRKCLEGLKLQLLGRNYFDPVVSLSSLLHAAIMNHFILYYQISSL